MNNEMLLYQARQDFIDMHFDLFRGKAITLEHYDQITQELLRMDEINLELTLEYIEQTEHVPIKHVFHAVRRQIDQLKQRDTWSAEKLLYLQWSEDGLITGPQQGHK